MTLEACCLVLVKKTMLADIRCLFTTIPSSIEHTASLKVDAVCYVEFYKELLLTGAVLRPKKVKTYLWVMLNGIWKRWEGKKKKKKKKKRTTFLSKYSGSLHHNCRKIFPSFLSEMKWNCIWLERKFIHLGHETKFDLTLRVWWLIRCVRQVFPFEVWCRTSYVVHR